MSLMGMAPSVCCAYLMQQSLVLLLLIATTLVESKVQTDDRSLVVTDGSNITFTCRSDTGNAPRWSFYEVGVLEAVRKLSVQFVVSTQLSALSVVNVHRKNAGAYVCHEAYRSGQNVSFQLVVLAKDPECNGRELLVECDVHYAGNLAPVVSCVTDDVNSDVQNDQPVVTASGGPWIVTKYSRTFKSGVSKSSVVCTIHFDASALRGSVMQAEPPTYRRLWTNFLVEPVSSCACGSLQVQIVISSRNASQVSTTASTGVPTVEHTTLHWILTIMILSVVIIACITGCLFLRASIKRHETADSASVPPIILNVTTGNSSKGQENRHRRSTLPEVDISVERNGTCLQQLTTLESLDSRSENTSHSDSIANNIFNGHQHCGTGSYESLYQSPDDYEMESIERPGDLSAYASIGADNL